MGAWKKQYFWSKGKAQPIPLQQILIEWISLFILLTTIPNPHLLVFILSSRHETRLSLSQPTVKIFNSFNNSPTCLVFRLFIIIGPEKWWREQEEASPEGNRALVLSDSKTLSVEIVIFIIRNYSSTSVNCRLGGILAFLCSFPTSYQSLSLTLISNLFLSEHSI